MRWIQFALTLLLLSSFISCHYRHSYTRLSLGVTVAPVMVHRSQQGIYTHDGHIHDEFCGHPRRWYKDRWVYFYNGRWEYYDYNEGVYYYLPDGLIEDSDE